MSIRSEGRLPVGPRERDGSSARPLRKGRSACLTLLNQLPYRSGHVFDRHAGVDPVLIEKVDGLDLEPLERAFDGLLDVLRPAIQSRRSLHPAGIEMGIQVESELGGDRHPPAEGSQRLAQKLFVQERPVDLGGVEEGDAALDGGMEQRGHRLLVLGRAVGETHSHAAEAEGRDFQVALAESASLHRTFL